MGYDKNNCEFSGTIIELKDIPTKTGTRMASLKIQCWKEQIRACAFEEYADILLEYYEQGSRIEFGGKLQTSSWENNGTKYVNFQVNINEIVGHRVAGDTRPGLENVDYAGGPF